MSYPLTQLGGRALNHSHNDAAEAEYDRLRALAREELGKRSHYLDRARQSYDAGDGAAAHEFSQQAKRHAQLADQYNRQASEFIFRENNSQSRTPSDTIDLHGQYVEEAVDILQQRIAAAQAQRQSHLHVIVGRGNHSVNHVQKLKPRVEQLCRELDLQYTVEPNAGRIFINLTGGPAYVPPQGQGASQHHTGQQQHHHQQEQNGLVEQAAKKLLPRVLRKLEACCIVM